MFKLFVSVASLAALLRAAALPLHHDAVRWSHISPRDGLARRQEAATVGSLIVPPGFTTIPPNANVPAATTKKPAATVPPAKTGSITAKPSNTNTVKVVTPTPTPTPRPSEPASTGPRPTRSLPLVPGDDDGTTIITLIPEPPPQEPDEPPAFPNPNPRPPLSDPKDDPNNAIDAPPDNPVPLVPTGSATSNAPSPTSGPRPSIAIPSDNSSSNLPTANPPSNPNETSTPDSNPESSQSRDRGPNVGAIVGAIAGVVFIGCAAIMWVRKYRQLKARDESKYGYTFRGMPLPMGRPMGEHGSRYPVSTIQRSATISSFGQDAVPTDWERFSDDGAPVGNSSRVVSPDQQYRPSSPPEFPRAV